MRDEPDNLDHNSITYILRKAHRILVLSRERQKIVFALVVMELKHHHYFENIDLGSNLIHSN